MNINQINRVLSSLKSKSYKVYNEKVRSGVYKTNKTLRKKNETALRATLNKIESGKQTKGTINKMTKLKALINILEKNTNKKEENENDKNEKKTNEKETNEKEDEKEKDEEVCSIMITSNKVEDIKVEDIINLFYGKCVGKENNDMFNKKREYVLAYILDGNFDSYTQDEEHGSMWTLLKNSWNDVLDDLYKKHSDKYYNIIKVLQKGGRKYNYDFDVEYYKDKTKVYTIKNIEFKYGAKSIDKIPQFFNAIANQPFLPGYASWFYDNYVMKEDPWTRFTAPSKDVYMKEIYKNSSKNKFFIELKAEEGNKDYYKKKQEKTRESIKQWLNKNYTNLDLEKLSNEFLRSQGDKVFILWDRDTFHVDEFDNNELTVSTIIGLNKEENSIVLNSKNNKIQYSMLLRWKNQLGVLLPAWQISMKRI